MVSGKSVTTKKGICLLKQIYTLLNIDIIQAFMIRECKKWGD